VTDQIAPEKSFMEARGLAAPNSDHPGPRYAQRMVELGCHVHPLRLGFKAPASEHGVLDASPDASAITGNYGVAMGASNLVVVDLDDYVPGNRIDEFIRDFELTPTFSIKTGSGGRSWWYQAPDSSTYRNAINFRDPGQEFGEYPGVDIKAANGYALGPGCRLHSSVMKDGGVGDGTYTFDKDGLTVFSPIPPKLARILAEAAKPIERQVEVKSLDQVSPEWIRAAVTGIAHDLREARDWPEHHTDEQGRGWDKLCADKAFSLAGMALDGMITLEEARKVYLDNAPRDNVFRPAEKWDPQLRAAEAKPEMRKRPLAEPDLFSVEDRSQRAQSMNNRPLTGDPWPERPWNQDGTFHRALQASDGLLRWLKDEEIWVEYQDVRWKRDKTAGPRTVLRSMRLAREYECANYSDERQKNENGDEKSGLSPREKFLKSMSDSSHAGTYRAVADAIIISGELDAVSGDFDRDPFLLGVGNGVLDLKRGVLLESAAEQMVSKGTYVEFNPEAEAPLFQRYLETSMPDSAMRDYLQAICGYSATGSTVEQAFFIHTGQTNNGKSVLMNILRELLGEHMGSASSKALVKTKNDKHSVELADLAGPRLLQMSETEEGAHLEEATIKQVTGGDRIAARKIAQSNQEWRIKGKIHILTNHLPHITPSPSNRRRIHLVKWPVEIKRPDLDLEEKIKQQELPGVLNWLVAGVQRWTADLKATLEAGEAQRPTGLIRPHTALMDLDEYLQDEDELGQWIMECTDGAGDVWTKSSTLYQSYKMWKFSRGGKELTQTTFSKKLKERGINRDARRDANYFQIRLHPQTVDTFFDS
jgi:P4 family phage/plasmid primase-like protien